MVARKTLVLCGLIGLMIVQTSEANIVYQKTEDLRNVNWTVATHNSLLTFVTCDVPKLSESIRKCNVSLTNMDNKSQPAMCEYALDKSLDIAGGYPFTENQAILVYLTNENSEKYYAQYEIVNFPDCKTVETKLNFGSFRDAETHFEENQEAILINEDNTFDVLYKDVKVCGDKICKLTIDAQGNKVRGPIASFVPINDAIKFVKAISSSQGFLATELKLNEAYKISLIKPDGQVVLKQYKTFDDIKDHDVSASHGSIRLCSKTNSTKVDCELFSYSGEMAGKVSVDIGVKAVYVTIQNLESNKFLLLAEAEEKSALIKINGNGSIDGVANLSHFDCDISSQYESELDVTNNHYCVNKACITADNVNNFRECFNEHDFH